MIKHRLVIYWKHRSPTIIVPSSKTTIMEEAAKARKNGALKCEMKFNA